LKNKSVYSIISPFDLIVHRILSQHCLFRVEIDSPGKPNFANICRFAVTLIEKAKKYLTSYLDSIAESFGIHDKALWESRISLKQEHIEKMMRGGMDIESVQEVGFESKVFQQGIFLDKYFEDPHLQNIAWEDFFTRGEGSIKSNVNSLTHLNVDFRSVLFLGSWAQLEIYLEPWRCLRINDILREFGKVQIGKNAVFELVFDKDIGSDIIDGIMILMNIEKPHHKYVDTNYLEAKLRQKGSSSSHRRKVLDLTKTSKEEEGEEEEEEGEEEEEEEEEGGEKKSDDYPVQFQDQERPKKAIIQQDTTKVFFPCNFGKKHWYLVVANLTTKVFYWYDSLGVDRENVAIEIRKLLAFWMFDENVLSFRLEKGGCPKQISNDCGAFLLLNAVQENIGEGDVSYPHSEPRKIIYEWLLNKKIEYRRNSKDQGGSADEEEKSAHD